MENNILIKLEDILKDLSPYQKKGLDTSSLKIFIKNFKDFLEFNDPISLPSKNSEINFDEKLTIIKSFLEDRKAFPTIKDVINFANDRLNLDFKDQKESRTLTISRIITRISNKPELKDLLKKAVITLRNEIVHNGSKKSKKQIISVDTFNKWADIIKNI